MNSRAISSLTGRDRKTIRRYLRNPAAATVYKPRDPRPGKLDPFKSYLKKRCQTGVWNAVVLLRELRERGYIGGYTILKDYLRVQRVAAQQLAMQCSEARLGASEQVDDSHRADAGDAKRQESVWNFVFSVRYSRALMAEGRWIRNWERCCGSTRKLLIKGGKCRA